MMMIDVDMNNDYMRIATLMNVARSKFIDLYSRSNLEVINNTKKERRAARYLLWHECQLTNTSVVPHGMRQSQNIIGMSLRVHRHVHFEVKERVWKGTGTTDFLKHHGIRSHVTGCKICLEYFANLFINNAPIGILQNNDNHGNAITFTLCYIMVKF